MSLCASRFSSVYARLNFQLILNKVNYHSCRRRYFIRKDIDHLNALFYKGMSTAPNSAVSCPQQLKATWENIIKSPNDSRLYRGIELQNGLKAVLVSDPSTDKSSACLDVHIGSMSDPNDLPGLAHFCEHMLFLGTTKYPEENAYSRFLNEHGGSANAFTDNESTNFFFDVSPPHLADVMDIFAQFFIAPLFTESATEREVLAVDSENAKNLRNDMRRVMQLDRSLSASGHDYNKFSTGNRDTLLDLPAKKGINTRQQLLDFHNTHYSANIMTLCILGKESIDELTDLVVRLFNEVENKNKVIRRWDTSPYTDEWLRRRVYVVPIRDVRELQIMWPIPDLRAEYKAHPESYLSHLLGHEAAGSILSELKARGWSNKLVAGPHSAALGFASLSVSVDLSETGIDNVDSIVELVFQYLNMLRKEGPQLRVFEEERDLRALRFRFKEKENPMNCTIEVAHNMLRYSMEDILAGSLLLTEFKPHLITELLDCLTPDKCRIFVMGKKFEDICTEKETWYGTNYCNQPISEETLQRWRACGTHPNLYISKPNPYIPTEFGLKLPTDSTDSAVSTVASVPELLLDTKQSRLWFKQDDFYRLPKTYITFHLMSPLSYSDPLSAVLTMMLVEVFQDAVNEASYDASLAGLSIGMKQTNQGLKLSLSGYTHKISVLVREMLRWLVGLELDPQRFACLRETKCREVANFEMAQPYAQGDRFLGYLLSETFWLHEDMLAVFPDVTVEALKRFIVNFFSCLFIETLVYGNATREDALAYHNMVESVLVEQMKTRPAMPAQISPLREVLLPPGSHHVFQRVNEHHPTSAVSVYLQSDEQNTRSNMVNQLFDQIIADPFFNVLRTQEQLGYIVHADVRRSHLMQGLRVHVQSSKRPDVVEERIDSFFASLETLLQEMAEDEFRRHVTALVDNILEKPKEMVQQFSRYWTEIVCGHYNFNRDQIESDHLKTLTKNDVLDYYRTYYSPSSSSRKKLAVHILSSSVHGSTIPALGETYQGRFVEDGIRFKHSLPLSALAQPVIPVGRGSARL